MSIQLYDTTLRDGAQREGISFSVEDKVKIARKLDELGIHFIEGGWPGSNPKDTEFFRRMQSISLSNSILVAFGSTRRKNIRAEDDPNIRALLETKLKVVTLVGKGSAEHVTRILKTSLAQNLAMIADSVRYLKSKGLTVFFDAEHFFDGYKIDAQYALRTIETAAEAGAECLVLCDTNGGSMPDEIAAIVAAVRGQGSGTSPHPVPLTTDPRQPIPVGIHAHNDMELAVANTLAAVRAGATHVQGTINGYGERCGNANLCSILPALRLKMGIDCVNSEQLARLAEISRYVSEIANQAPFPHLPYVGASAFGHKAGMHIAAMAKTEESYQHIDPSLVGNRSRILVSELSGVSTILYKAKEYGLGFAAPTPQARGILKQVKYLENQGFKYDDAEASFELLLHRAQPDYRPPFELVDFMVVVEKHRRSPTSQESRVKGRGTPDSRLQTPDEEGTLSEAMVKVKVGEDIYHTAAEGSGPVNALDQALRKALLQFYPDLAVVKLIDFKVRILEESRGTEARVRVLIESSDGQQQWSTVGSSTNIIEASWISLADSLEYWLLKKGLRKLG
ncbi:MAG: (R)-citramalate synthase [Dehalococcoidia bacterium]|nr:(R)-citramalate synthase [Chloroflexota bacterium]